MNDDFETNVTAQTTGISKGEYGMPIIARIGHTRFVLVDANVVAGYYLPESLESSKVRDRITNTLEAVRKHGMPELFVFIPSLCVPEVFAVFSRHKFARWDPAVKRRFPRDMDGRRYASIRKRFHDDLHNGKLLQQVALDRYHILATDLISPVDAYYQYHRHRTGGKKRKKQMMGAADHAIIGMGIQLSRVHGRENFAILTADQRLANILTRATSVKLATAQKLGLLRTAKELGLEYGPDIYPQVFNLAKTKVHELAEFFGTWPLPLRVATKRGPGSLRKSDEELLAKLRLQSGIGRDSLPYTPAFESICKEFEKRTGRSVDRHEAWLAIGRVEKRSKKK